MKDRRIRGGAAAICLVAIGLWVESAAAMTLTSPAFKAGEPIPRRYTCQGKDVSPPLTIQDIPEGTRSLALIVEDPDAPNGLWVHWVVYNISPRTAMAEGDIPGQQGRNDFGRTAYGGPCPPWGEHRYFFRLWALDTVLPADPRMTRDHLLKRMQGHVLAESVLMGVYRKQ